MNPSKQSLSPVFRSVLVVQEALKDSERVIHKSGLIDEMKQEKTEYSEAVVNNIKHEPPVEFELILPPDDDGETSFNIKSIDEKSTTTSSSESDAKEKFNNELQTCSFCDKKYINVSRHYRTRPCTICQQIFECGTLKKSHLEAGHDGTLQCKECSYIAKNLSSLLSHRKIHLNSVSCGICQQKFDRKYELKVHQTKFQHGIYKNLERNPEEKAQCDICGKICLNRVWIRRHMFTHLNLMCIVCKKLVVKSSIESHMEDHKSDNLMECPKCSKVLKKKNLKMHNERMHLRQLRFKADFKKQMHKKIVVECATCKKMIPERSINNHMFRHTLPFKCPRCETKCLNEESLKRHILTIHVEFKLFDCHFCIKQYRHKKGLMRHIRDRHHEKKS